MDATTSPLAVRRADRLLSLVRRGNLQDGYDTCILRSFGLFLQPFCTFSPSNPADDHVPGRLISPNARIKASLWIQMLGPFASAQNVVDFRILHMSHPLVID